MPTEIRIRLRAVDLIKKFNALVLGFLVLTSLYALAAHDMGSIGERLLIVGVYVVAYCVIAYICFVAARAIARPALAWANWVEAEIAAENQRLVDEEAAQKKAERRKELAAKRRMEARSA